MLLVSDVALLLRVPLFPRLLAARTISNFGNGMAPIAISFGVLGLEGATPTSLSLVLGVHALALVVALPFGGVWADRLPRAKVIAVTDMMVSIVVLTMALLFIFDSATVPLLMLLGACSGVLNGLWYPAFPGLTPDVIRDPDRLQSANAVVAVGSNTAYIAGTAVGGILVALIGSGVALLVDATSFFIAGILVWTLRRVSTAAPSGESLVRDLRDGWASFLSFRWVAVIVACFSVIVAAFQAAAGVLGPVLMKANFNGPSSWATVLAAESIGFLVGAVVGSRWRPSRPLVVGTVSTLTCAVWLFTMAIPAPLYVIAGAAFLWGVSFDLFGILWITALQTHVPKSVFSRVMSYDAMGSLILGPLGIALAGPAVGWIGLRMAFLIAGGLVVVMVFVALTEPMVRNLRSGGLPPAVEPDPLDSGASPLGARTPPAF
jgi:hypothetical protein